MCFDFNKTPLGPRISIDFVTRVSEDVSSVVRTLEEFVNCGWSYTQTLSVRVVFYAYQDFRSLIMDQGDKSESSPSVKSTKAPSVNPDAVTAEAKNQSSPSQATDVTKAPHEDTKEEFNEIFNKTR